MIKAEELRVGNLVKCFLKRTDARIISIKEIEAAHVNDNEYCYPYEIIHGILLTPELLLKCGFVGSDSDDLPKRILYGIQVANNTALYYDEFCDKLWYLSYEWNNNHFQNDFWGKPEYLHQLQNLYYALTGEELKIEF